LKMMPMVYYIYKHIYKVSLYFWENVTGAGRNQMWTFEPQEMQDSGREV
jgi:hypothetical protein